MKHVFFYKLDIQVTGRDGKGQGTPFVNADTDPSAPRAFVYFIRRYRDADTLCYIRKMTALFSYISDTYLMPERKVWKR